MVWITLILFLGMMSLLGYRWLSMEDPNGFIMINGSKDFSGAEVVVTDSTDQPLSHERLTSSDDYHLRIPLPQGTYRIEITLGDKTLLREPITLKEGSGMVFNLDQTATTQPAAE